MVAETSMRPIRSAKIFVAVVLMPSSLSDLRSEIKGFLRSQPANHRNSQAHRITNVSDNRQKT
jgi:hypothetical protein